MKKILLMLVSGLLIACMAGSAIAGDTVLNPDPVTLENGKADVTTSITIVGAGTYQTQVYTSTSGLSAYLESSGPIAVGDASNWAGVTPMSGLSFVVSQVPKTYTGTLHIKGNEAGTVTIDTGYSDGTHIISIYSVETVTVQVPEFPTIALPVAAVLGLLFVFGRKKEGL